MHIIWASGCHTSSNRNLCNVHSEIANIVWTRTIFIVSNYTNSNLMPKQFENATEMSKTTINHYQKSYTLSFSCSHQFARAHPVQTQSIVGNKENPFCALISVSVWDCVVLWLFFDCSWFLNARDSSNGIIAYFKSSTLSNMLKNRKSHRKYARSKTMTSCFKWLLLLLLFFFL